MVGEEIITEAVASVAKETYDDVVHPTAKNVGDALGTLTGVLNHIFLYPLKMKVAAYEQKYIDFKEGLSKKCETIPASRIVEPQLHIIGPTIESLKYNILDDTLAELFSNLLASNIDSQTQNMCTPAFVKVIEQLSPNDAKTFKFIYDKCRYKYGYPICKIKFIPQDTRKGTLVFDLIPSYFTNVTISGMNELDISKSIQNLFRLGLIDMSVTTFYSDKTIYQDICDNSKQVKKIIQIMSERGDIFVPEVYDAGIIQINEFSKDFAKVCLRDKV